MLWGVSGYKNFPGKISSRILFCPESIILRHFFCYLFSFLDCYGVLKPDHVQACWKDKSSICETHSDVKVNDTETKNVNNEMTGFFDQFQKMNISTRQIVLYNMLKSLRQDPKSVEAYTDMEQIKKFFAFQIESDNPLLSTSTTERYSQMEDDMEEFQDHAGEDIDGIGTVPGHKSLVRYFCMKQNYPNYRWCWRGRSGSIYL